MLTDRLTHVVLFSVVWLLSGNVWILRLWNPTCQNYMPQIGYHNTSCSDHLSMFFLCFLSSRIIMLNDHTPQKNLYWICTFWTTALKMDIDKKQIQRFFGGTSFYSDPNRAFTQTQTFSLLLVMWNSSVLISENHLEICTLLLLEVNIRDAPLVAKAPLFLCCNPASVQIRNDSTYHAGVDGDKPQLNS